MLLGKDRISLQTLFLVLSVQSFINKSSRMGTACIFLLLISFFLLDRGGDRRIGRCGSCAGQNLSANSCFGSCSVSLCHWSGLGYPFDAQGFTGVR